jgi:C1A family cysteine protease
MCPANAVYDGHSILLVGYRDDANQPGGGVFLFRNTNNGGHDGSMPYIYAQAYVNDAVWIDSKK